MPRYTFFSFAYEDVKNFKVNIVRNSGLLKSQQESFVDGSIWESEKTKGPAALKKIIETGLNKTSVTAVLIGETTANRRWVNYEIVKSFDRGNGILGVHINRVKGKTGLTARGLNPLDRLGFQISEDGAKIHFFELKNNRWRTYEDLPVINNKKSNTLWFDHHWWYGNKYGEFFKFSDYFKTYCWDFDTGHKNFFNWVEQAAQQAGR